MVVRHVFTYFLQLNDILNNIKFTLVLKVKIPASLTHITIINANLKQSDETSRVVIAARKEHATPSQKSRGNNKHAISN
jgi:hypothetical protein